MERGHFLGVCVALNLTALSSNSSLFYDKTVCVCVRVHLRTMVGALIFPTPTMNHMLFRCFCNVIDCDV